MYTERVKLEVPSSVLVTGGAGFTGPFLTEELPARGADMVVVDNFLNGHGYNKQYDIDTSAVRIFTAYGPRENETHAIIAFIPKAYARQDPFQIRGDGEQTQNFSYVKDITNALRLTAENITDGNRSTRGSTGT